MKLQRREKILAGLALGLVGLAGLWFLLFAGDSRSFDQLLAEQTRLASEIQSKQILLQAASRDAKRLAEWQRRGLPPKASLARSLYQNWLRSLAARVNFRGSTLVSNDAGARRDQFTRISFTLRARARLGDLVEFMYKFYQAGFLHQIRRLDVKPIQSSLELDVNLTIEALSLPTAQSKDRLPQETGHVLQLAKLSDYRPIVSRDFFTAYVPPAPASALQREKSVDRAEFAVVTAFTEVDGAWKVWLQDRIGDKLWQLESGESFTVGDVKGTVQSIHPEGEVIVDLDGHRRLLHVGDSLHGGVEMPDQRPNQPEEAVKSPRLTSDRGN
jgi:hypothetical protein